MATHRVEIVKIDEILDHPNADRLELAQIKGWQVVVGKGEYKAGDSAIYIPIDSVLGEILENYLFPPDAKIKLSKSRVKSIRIRKAISQGMLVNPKSVGLLNLFPSLRGKRAGSDVADILGVTKYEPPVPEYQKIQKKGSWKNNPLFTKYTDIENFKYHPDLFEDTEAISVTEKLHGTSARYGVLERNPNPRFGWVSKVFDTIMRRSPFEFVYGSRNVQLQTGGKIFYDENVYAKVAKSYNLENKLQPGEVLYGEIVGEGIQKGFDYGFKKGEYGFFPYDVKVDGKYLDADEFDVWCLERGIRPVPLIDFMTWRLAKSYLKHWVSGPSLLSPHDQKVREGIVLKPMKERMSHIGRPVLKYINDDYLMLKGNSDFH